MTGCPPWPRALLTAAVITGISVALHQLGGGSVTPGAVLLVLAVLVLLVRGTQGAPGVGPRTVALVLGGQIAAHVLLTPVHVARHAVAAGHDTHSGMRHSYDALGPQLVSWIHDSLSCLLADPGMTAAHVVAAGLTGAWLAAGERRAVAAVRIVADHTAAWLRGLERGLPIEPERVVPVVATREPLGQLAARRCAWSLVRRGPPAGVVA